MHIGKGKTIVTTTRRKQRRIAPTRRHALRILKGVMDRAFRRHFAQRSRVSGDRLGLPDASLPALDTVFADIAVQTKARCFEELPDEIGSLLEEVAARAYTGYGCRGAVERAILRDLTARAAEYELLSQMPIAKQERKTRPPMTAVQRRAVRVDEKVIEWERKLKMAKTKLASYRRKQKYYQKKGAVN